MEKKNNKKLERFDENLRFANFAIEQFINVRYVFYANKKLVDTTNLTFSKFTLASVTTIVGQNVT